jgi:toxin ParE1/3/4
MARYRLSRPAKRDLAKILATSADRWGKEGRRRYSALLVRAMREAAAEPHGVATRDRSELQPGVRSIHLRHARVDDPELRVRDPVHLLYFRPIGEDVIEIVRVLHERMEPDRELGGK